MVTNELQQTEFDCAVIGGGPAGSTVAALVAAAGMRTLLMERDRMPRFHVGESLMPETYWIFKRLGVMEQLRKSAFVHKVGVQFVGPSGRQFQPFHFKQHDPRECSQTWHVDRDAFDKMLFDNAVVKGATGLEGTRVLDVELRSEGSHELRVQHSNSREDRITARVVVDATGQQAFLANRLNLKIDNPKLHKAAIWGYFRGAQRNSSDDAELTTILHTDEKRCWFWYIPLGDDRTSVGLVGDHRDLLHGDGSVETIFKEQQQCCPGLSSRLEKSQRVGKLQVAKEFSYTTRQHAGDGWVLVGDAYGFIDPIYSTGVFLALKSAELAADSIVTGLRQGDTTAEVLGQWTAEYNAGVLLFRKMVDAFYTNEFSFAEFIKAHPEHQRNLTDLLIGRAFATGADRIFQDLDPALERSIR